VYPRRLLPGLAVEVPPATVADALPRMDVALFAGFAARGPVHRPVLIESVAAYAAVFGSDLALAGTAGEAIYATLPSCVRGFFSNGGIRAWVIRLARTEALEARRGSAGKRDGTAAMRTFSLLVDGPGLPALQVAAASLGSWADAMRVSARLDRRGRTPALMLRAEIDSEASVMGPFSLDPADPASWWAVTDDDAAYARAETVPGPRGWLAPTGAPALYALSGLSDDWSEPVGADPDSRTALERNGLSRFDASLFLDPALGDASVLRLADEAGRLRDIDGVQLLGIHGAFAVPGGSDFGEPSLIAVPDAAQPAWRKRPVPEFRPPQAGPWNGPVYWRDHRGSCAVPPADSAATGPDATRFLDCGTRLLETPAFAPLDPLQRDDHVELTWSESESGAIYVLEESGRADFSGAVEIWRGTERSFIVETRRDGLYFYRVHAEHDGNVSRPALTGFAVQALAWEAVPQPAGEDSTLLEVQAALLRMCASMGDQFALLALPEHFRSEAAATHAAALSSRFSGTERPLSFGAMYHPWLVGAIDGERQQLTRAVPPEGAVAGTYARRARERGPWIAPARMPVSDIVALAPHLPDHNREGMATVRINLVRRDPLGFVASDCLTLSPEPDWGQVNVRRLMSQLRRAAMRWGAPFVFEPYGDTLRRAIERTFGHALDEMVERGAFAGKGRQDSYRLAVDAKGSDRTNGKLVIEIAVAPAQPMRFLTLVLAQTGERFTVAEER
jgi:phage tail sheath protein FI